VSGSQDQHDELGGAKPNKIARDVEGKQPSNSLARVCPNGKPCKGWPSATASGG
jgi:hypothetical protein